MNTGVSGETVVKARTAAVSYDRRTIRSHWASAVLMTVLWGMAQIIDLFPTARQRSPLAPCTSPSA
jgi:hypothetical protein